MYVMKPNNLTIETQCISGGDIFLSIYYNSFL